MFADPGPWGREDWWQSPDPNGDALVRLGLAVALAVFLASFFEAHHMPMILSGWFEAGAYMAALLATLREDIWRAPYVTAWDEAALLMLLALIARAFAAPGLLTTATLAGG